jgi:iron complex outermembrane receptor protein
MNCALTGLNGLSGHFADTRYDYRAAFSYDFTDNLMGYAQYTTGYKGGGINPRPFYPAQVLSFSPETIDAYEVGLKSQLFDRTLRLNAAFFWNQYKDMQIGINDCSAYTGPPGNPFGVPCIYPANAGDADVKGGELEANWYPIEGLEIDAAVSVLNFDYTKLAPATGIPADGITPYTPETKWSLGAQYRFAFTGGSSITPRIDVTYQSDIYGNPLNSVTSKIDAYTLLNARLTWNSPDDVWQVALEGQNLTDELYFVTKFDLLAAAGGFQSGQPGLPRTVMLKFKRSF